ncbi:MAG: 50S ribosomal protein L3 [bacterium]|nr:50S ribosomal protein L3 [bacterium]
MALRLLGTKLGMTQIFEESGEMTPVTIIELAPNIVIQKKTVETDKYSALQLGYESKSAKNTSKPEIGHTKKAGQGPLRFLRESRVDGAIVDNYNLGDEIKVDFFTTGETVDVTGVTKGRGFAGVIKRHGMHGTASLTHGAHEVMRHAGSIGASATPARVFRGKRMAGRYGNDRQTTQNLRVVDLRVEENILIVKGAVSGRTGGLVMVQKSIKAKR